MKSTKKICSCWIQSTRILGTNPTTKSWQFTTSAALTQAQAFSRSSARALEWLMSSASPFLSLLRDVTCVEPLLQSPGVMLATWWLFPATKLIYHLRGLLGFNFAWLTLKHLILHLVCHLGRTVSWKGSQVGQHQHTLPLVLQSIRCLDFPSFAI